MNDADRIEERLSNLDNLYCQAMNSPEDSDLPQLYSKIAIIELGGWVEEKRDELTEKMFDYLFSNPDEQRNKLFGENNKYINGFHYKTHFVERIFQKVLGHYGALRIEKALNLDPETHELFKSALGNLWKKRSQCAHRTIEGTTQNIDAPGTTKTYFTQIKNGLRNLEKVIDTTLSNKKNFPVV